MQRKLSHAQVAARFEFRARHIIVPGFRCHGKFPPLAARTDIFYKYRECLPFGGSVVIQMLKTGKQLAVTIGMS